MASESRPRFLIGIDGGGSGTRARLADASGTVLATGEAGPSALAQGIAPAWASIRQAIARAFGAAGLAEPGNSECAIGLGLSGVHSPARRDALLAHMPPDFWRIAIDTDAFTTVLGAHAGHPGAVVAAGTGSVGEALRADGSRVSVGGWGFAVGDEGSGAWLGLHAVGLAQRAIDGRAPAGALAESVCGVIGHSLSQVQDWCAGAGQNAYARLAPLVFESEAADRAAADLLARGARELEAVARALDPAAALPLALCGSLGRRFQPRLSADLQARCVVPVGESADGALLLLGLHAFPG